MITPFSHTIKPRHQRYTTHIYTHIIIQHTVHTQNHDLARLSCIFVFISVVQFSSISNIGVWVHVKFLHRLFYIFLFWKKKRNKEKTGSSVRRRNNRERFNIIIKKNVKILTASCLETHILEKKKKRVNKIYRSLTK